jgi:predicted kinase
MKNVDILIGIPCSGKSTFRNNSYNQNDIFVISRDDIRNELIKEYEIPYQDMFKKPTEEDHTIHPLYGIKTQNGTWSNIEKMNEEFKERFEFVKSQAVKEIQHGKRIVVDLTNTTKSDRQDIKDLFKDVKDVSFNAYIFEFERNLNLIKQTNQSRGLKQENVIPDFVFDGFIDKFENVDKEENFNNIIGIDGLKGLKRNNKIQRKIH